jgi:hypothetical protein
MALFGVVTSRPSLPPVPAAPFSKPFPAAKNTPVRKIGDGLQGRISAAGEVGADVVKTSVAVAGTTLKAAGEVVRGGYKAIGGAEGVQKGAEAAGKVATEVIKVGTILVIEASKAIFNGVKGAAEHYEVQKSRDASGNTRSLNGPDDHAHYYIIDDDD